MQQWLRVRNPIRVLFTVTVVALARYVPSLRVKNWLYRRLGMTVGDGVGWALEATPDMFFPELITIEADAIVGHSATILCHEFLSDEYRTGRVTIGSEAMIGAGATVLPGVEIGAGAQVGANSLVTRDVPAGATVMGVPAEVVSEPDD